MTTMYKVVYRPNSGGSAENMVEFKCNKIITNSMNLFLVHFLHFAVAITHASAELYSR